MGLRYDVTDRENFLYDDANSLKILQVGSYVGLQNNELQQKLLFAKNGKSAIDCKKSKSVRHS